MLLHRFLTLFLSLPVTIGWTRTASGQETRSEWNWQIALRVGYVSNNADIAEGTNATGGERLFGNLDAGAILGIVVGLHGDLFGVEGSFLSTTERVEVENEFGVSFPNHGENVSILSIDGLLYPFQRNLLDGRLRPYITTGVGTANLSADLDNIGGQDSEYGFIWNAGIGLKWFFSAEEPSVFFDIGFRNHHLFDVGDFRASDLTEISVGTGFSF